MSEQMQVNKINNIKLFDILQIMLCYVFMHVLLFSPFLNYTLFFFYLALVICFIVANNHILTYIFYHY